MNHTTIDKYYRALSIMEDRIKAGTPFSMRAHIKKQRIAREFSTVVKDLGIAESYCKKGAWKWRWTGITTSEKMAEAVYSNIRYNFGANIEPVIGDFRRSIPKKTKKKRARLPWKILFIIVILLIITNLILIFTL